MIKYTKKELNRYLREELKGYEVKTGEITVEERSGLHEWVADGNRVYVNPWYLSEENGQPMDYVSAHRIVEDMNNNPEDYLTFHETESCALKNDMPF